MVPRPPHRPVCAWRLRRFSYDCRDLNGTNPLGESASTPICGDPTTGLSLTRFPALAMRCSDELRSTPFPPTASRSGGVRRSTSAFGPAFSRIALSARSSTSRRRSTSAGVLRLVAVALTFQNRDELERALAAPARALAVAQHPPLPEDLVRRLPGRVELLVLRVVVIVVPGARPLGRHRALVRALRALLLLIRRRRALRRGDLLLLRGRLLRRALLLRRGRAEVRRGRDARHRHHAGHGAGEDARAHAVDAVHARGAERGW